jgi:hypothetical protein
MLLTLLSVLSALAAEPAPADPVVARVQTVDILASEFAAAAKKAKPADGKALTEAERRTVLDGLIDNRLIWLEAKKSEAALAHPAVQKALVAAYLSEVTAASVGEPTEAELRAFYDANQALFTNPAVVRGSRILVAVGPKVTAEQAKAKAATLLAAVKDNPKKTFAATAKKSSADVNKAEGGDMGLVARNDKRVDATVRKVLWTTKVGKVSEVFMTREGANIVWAAGKREQGLKTFEQAQPDVLKRWKAAKLLEARNDKVAKLEKASRVRVDDAALAAVPLPAARGAAAAKGKPAAAKVAGKAAAGKAAAGAVEETDEEDESEDESDDGSED